MLLFPAPKESSASGIRTSIQNRSGATRERSRRRLLGLGLQSMSWADTSQNNGALGSPLLFRYVRPRCGLAPRGLCLSPTHSDCSWASYSSLARSCLSLTLPTTDASRCSQTSRFSWPCEPTTDGVVRRFNPDLIRQPAPKTDGANPAIVPRLSQHDTDPQSEAPSIDAIDVAHTTSIGQASAHAATWLAG
jgi:hypothetical protein